MPEALNSLIDLIRSGSIPSQKELDAFLRSFNKKNHDATRRISKRRLLSFYMDERRKKTSYYRSLNITDSEHDTITALLRAKPRRTASGVATVSVLTMPWPCKGDCIYCPNDIRMPKSYMCAEPACQRAERCYFDPYLQVASRLLVLEDMGHSIDKVELIVLGGTFSDYPPNYREWFTSEMFRALNEARTPLAGKSCEERRERYKASGLKFDDANRRADTSKIQAEIDRRETSYNDALPIVYSQNLWKLVFSLVDEAQNDLEELQARNESAASRNVGLVFETRPECIDAQHLVHLRRLGATKLQIGIQSLDDEILDGCERPSKVTSIANALSLMREMGLKSHVHFMANLPHSTPDKDIAIWDKLSCDKRFLPDEVKVYPCALVQSAHMMAMYENGKWHPYNYSELEKVLLHCLETTPPYMRISRMIRDICSQDIVAGNKHTNLRQMIENEAATQNMHIDEMRYREIGTGELDQASLHMCDYTYDTSNTQEHFLQWQDEKGRLAAFCRVSLPSGAQHAMIRELHVYGKSTGLGNTGDSAQHKGLGKKLIDKAVDIALSNHRHQLHVISAVGTRDYYRMCGFKDNGLYQTMAVLK